MASTAHLDSQGHHPKVWPYNRRNKIWGFIKVAARLSPKSVHLSASDNELQETMIVEMGCADSGMWYVDTAGCGMLQANDAEPPPKRGWLYKAVQCVAVFLLGLMLLAGPASCKKDPQPTPTPNTPTDTIPPVNPGDTITPVVPGDTIPDIPGDTIIPEPGGDTVVPGMGGTKEHIVDLYPGSGGWHCLPSVDSVRYWVQHYDTVILFISAPDNAWTPRGFHAASDSLRKRFNISPKVYGGWWWTPYQILPNEYLQSISVKGMIRDDSIQFANWGYGIYPQVSKGTKIAKSAQPPRYNGNRVLKAGRSR